jgi:hypothetical protein
MYGWLINCLLFYVPLKNFSLIWRRHNCRWTAAKFRLMLGTQRLWAGRDLYRATPAVTRSLSFSGLIQRTAPFSCLLRHTGMWRIYSNPGPRGYCWRTRQVFCYYMYPVTVSEQILPHKNIRISLPIKEHNQRPKECQWARPPMTT